MITLSPKSLYTSDPNFKTHADLVVSHEFRRTLMVALAEMEMNLPQTGNPSQSWDAHAQMVGARTFISTLLNLCEPHQTHSPLPRKDLNFDTEITNKPKKP